MPEGSNPEVYKIRPNSIEFLEEYFDSGVGAEDLDIRAEEFILVLEKILSHIKDNHKDLFQVAFSMLQQGVVNPVEISEKFGLSKKEAVNLKRKIKNIARNVVYEIEGNERQWTKSLKKCLS